MGDVQEIADVETASSVKTDEDLVNRSNIRSPCIIRTSDNIVMKSMENKEGGNLFNKLDEHVENEKVEDDEEEDAKSSDVDNDMESSSPIAECKVPTFVEVHKNDFDGDDDDEEVVIPVSIQPLNSDNPVPVAEEGEKRKRKRVPRKIEKVDPSENNTNQAPVDNKPYKCDMCHWQFKQRYRFKRHMRTHTGERPYQCPQCEKQFSRSHILKVHMMIHTGEKPFQCEECGWSFMKKYHLQRHMRTHTGEMPFVCEECGVHFSRQYYLKKHLVSAHGATIIIAPPKPKKKPAAAVPDGMVVENKDTIQVVFAFKEDELMEARNGSDEAGDSSAKDENLENQQSNKNEENVVKEESMPVSNDEKSVSNGQSASSNGEVHNTIIYSSNRNGTSIVYENEKSAKNNGHSNPIILDESDNVLSFSSESNETIDSSNPPNASNSNKGEASLKECIEMVNQLVDRKPMEAMTLKHEVVNTNNETESRMDIDFNSIPVK